MDSTIRIALCTQESVMPVFVNVIISTQAVQETQLSLRDRAYYTRH